MTSRDYKRDSRQSPSSSTSERWKGAEQFDPDRVGFNTQSRPIRLAKVT